MAVLVVNLPARKGVQSLASSHHERMANKKSKEESGKATLARVKKEMAEPRLARSARIEELNVEGHQKGRKGHA
jgi:hypothetical protein